MQLASRVAAGGREEDGGREAEIRAPGMQNEPSVSIALHDDR